jgi:hypothetical protein
LVLDLLAGAAMTARHWRRREGLLTLLPAVQHGGISGWSWRRRRWRRWRTRGSGACELLSPMRDVEHTFCASGRSGWQRRQADAAGRRWRCQRRARRRKWRPVGEGALTAGAVMAGASATAAAASRRARWRGAAAAPGGRSLGCRVIFADRSGLPVTDLAAAAAAWP